MGRYVAEYTIGQPDDFIRLVSEDYFQKEGFKLVPYKGEMLWKKGRGVLTAPQYIKLAYGQGIVHVEAFIRWTILPGVYVGEMALDNGFVGAIPKSMLMDKVNTLLRLLSQPMPAAAPARGTAAVIPRSPGTSSGRSHNCLSNDSPLRHTAA